MELTSRQKEIVEIVKTEEPVTSQELASRLNLTRAALRTDLALLTMAGFLEAKPRVGYFYNRQNSPVWLSKALQETGVETVQGLPVVINQEATVHNAVVQLFLEETETLFVVEEGNKVVGLVQAKDLLKVLIGGGENKDLPVKVAMSPLTSKQQLTENDSIYQALLFLQDEPVGAVPVFDEGGNLVGRVTREGILRFLRAQLTPEGGD